MQIQNIPTEKLVEYARNPRKNDAVVDKMIACIKEFGFRIPIVAKSNGLVVDGHLRLKAARKLGLKEVPVVNADDLSEAQIKAFRLVANQSANWAEWNEEFLRLELLDLKDMDFDLDLTGFDMSEVDRLVQENQPIEDDDFEENNVINFDKPISKCGDLWILGNHKLICGNIADKNVIAKLMAGKKADMVFTDSNRETQSEELNSIFQNMITNSKNGSIHYICADWKRMYEIISIGRKSYSEFKQLCFWKKDQARQNEFYKDQHELIFVFKNGDEKHINNFGLGETGRYRTNVWNYSENKFGAKPIPLIADAILDCSNKGDLILDLFGGSETTLIACEETNRKCFMAESDPKSVDGIIQRWQQHSGKKAIYSFQFANTYSIASNKLSNFQDKSPIFRFK